MPIMSGSNVQRLRLLRSVRLHRGRAHASKGFGPPPPPSNPSSKPKQERATTLAELKSLAAGESANSTHKTLHDKLGAVSVVFLGDETGESFSENPGPHGPWSNASVLHMSWFVLLPLLLPTRKRAVQGSTEKSQRSFQRWRGMLTWTRPQLSRNA